MRVREEGVILTKHICHKVVYRANKTIEKNPVVNISTALVFVWAGK